ncbi:MAG: TetR/AcrR family transcriptional regulator [Pseudomonadota bacterium]
MGRPRTFDMDDALERAMDLFWQKGYHAANLPDLLAAMGIVRGSFYKAFESKKDVFMRALALYEVRYLKPAIDMLTAKEARGMETIRAVFDGALELIRSGDPRGCLLCSTAAETAFHDADIAAAVNDQLDSLTHAFGAALAIDTKWAGAADDKRLAKAQSLTQHYVGLRVMQRSGRGYEALKTGVDDLFKQT